MDPQYVFSLCVFTVCPQFTPYYVGGERRPMKRNTRGHDHHGDQYLLIGCTLQVAGCGGERGPGWARWLL